MQSPNGQKPHNPSPFPSPCCRKDTNTTSRPASRLPLVKKPLMKKALSTR
ncbi:unnamed protein product [Ciceribacter selenitireducens ATCC BAA-1503]|uniref:Uncharacterized protein n=1 Tax=Ciceribacter selenitireducens ATCC BAA-1503 TaxID=1336235 RepID=A0A376AK81_9HYPH|nr:unnamed protein product [Ciceribacter selenitireducens ATCC BAA-1503]